MTKQEKSFVKFIGKKICEVLSSYNYRYSDELLVCEEESLKKDRYDEIQRLIEWAEDRGVDTSFIEFKYSITEVLYDNKNFIF